MLLAYWSPCITPPTPLCPLSPWSLSTPGVWALCAGDTAFRGSIRLENTELASPALGTVEHIGEEKRPAWKWLSVNTHLPSR